MELKKWEELPDYMQNDKAKRYYKQNIVFSRDRLLSEVWSVDYIGETRTVDMHIKTLRQKLGAAGGQIKTVIGVGYRLEGAE